MSNEPRRFTDEEFALVLRKAMALQDDAAPGRLGSGRPSSGLTLQDMRAVARDVGIDPELVDRAVALLPSEEVSGTHRLLGGPTRYRMEHSSSSGLDRDDLARILDTIRKETQHQGKVSSELDGLAWETVGEVSQFHVTLSPREGGTEVRLSVNRDAAFILTWFLTGTAGLVLAGATGGILDPESALVGVGIVAGGIGGALTAARVLWGRSTKAVRAKANRLMETLVREVERAAPENDDDA